MCIIGVVVLQPVRFLHPKLSATDLQILQGIQSSFHLLHFLELEQGITLSSIPDNSDRVDILTPNFSLQLADSHWSLDTSYKQCRDGGAGPGSSASSWAVIFMLLIISGVLWLVTSSWAATSHVSSSWLSTATLPLAFTLFVLIIMWFFIIVSIILTARSSTSAETTVPSESEFVK